MRNILIIFIILLVSCKSKLENNIIGEWQSENGNALVINEDSLKTSSNELIHYELTSDSLLVFKPKEGVGMTYKVLKAESDSLIIKGLLWTNEITSFGRVSPSTTLPNER